MVMVDFECYYDKDYGLSRMTYPIYITDERFELSAAGMAWWHPADGWSTPSYYQASELAIISKQDNDNVVWVAKNCKFDMMILKLVFGITPKYVIDIEDLTRYYDARMEQSLGKVADMIGAPPKGQTVQFKGKHLEDIHATSELWLAHIKYTKRDIETQCVVFDYFFPYLDVPGEELVIANMTHQMYLDPKFVFDHDLAIDTILAMSEQRELDIGDYSAEMLRSGIEFAKKLRSMLPPWQKLPLKKGKPSKNMLPITGDGKILACSKKDQGCKWLQVHPVRLVRELIKARMAEKSWPLHIKRFQVLVDQAKALGGLIWIPLKYCGAHTHRWSGTQGINPQNMAKLGKTAASKLLGLVRHLFRAPKGQVLLIADSAQIEARGLAWMAGEKELVHLFATGGDVYSSFAESLFGTPVFKWRDQKEEYKGHKDKVKGQRDFGKGGILGGGYGMGDERFHGTCLENDELLPRFESGEYDAAFCKKVINTYRNKYKKIVKFWSLVEGKFTSVTRYGGVKKLLIPGTMLCLEFTRDGTTTFIKLPSGRRLRYRNAVCTPSGLKYRHGKLWGGTLTENIIQSFCRDLICFWMLRCKEEGLPVLLTVHDEIVSMSLVECGAAKLALLMAVMREVPKWAKGMPIDVEGETSEHYKK